MCGAKMQNITEFLNEHLMVMFDGTKSGPIAVFVVVFYSVFAFD
jgi:hypothetical protein